MSWFFRRLPERHVELLVLALLTLGLICLLWLMRSQAEAARLAIIAQEILLPFGAGLVIPGLMAEDPALELLLSVPRPSRLILVERVALALAISAFLVGSLNLLTSRWGIYLPYSGARQLLVWLTPLVLFTGLSCAAALLRGRALDGSLVVLGACGAFLLTTPLLLSTCTDLQGGVCIWVLFTPLLTYIQPQAPDWLASRLIWLGIGLLLMLLSLRLSEHEETLIQALQLE